MHILKKAFLITTLSMGCYSLTAQIKKESKDLKQLEQELNEIDLKLKNISNIEIQEKKRFELYQKTLKQEIQQIKVNEKHKKDREEQAKASETLSPEQYEIWKRNKEKEFLKENKDPKK